MILYEQAFLPALDASAFPGSRRSASSSIVGHASQLYESHDQSCLALWDYLMRPPRDVSSLRHRKTSVWTVTNPFSQVVCLCDQALVYDCLTLVLFYKYTTVPHALMVTITYSCLSAINVSYHASRSQSFRQTGRLQHTAPNQTSDLHPRETRISIRVLES